MPPEKAYLALNTRHPIVHLLQAQHGGVTPGRRGRAAGGRDAPVGMAPPCPSNRARTRARARAQHGVVWGVAETPAVCGPLGQPLAPPRCRSPVRPRARWRERGKGFVEIRPAALAHSRSFDAGRSPRASSGVIRLVFEGAGRAVARASAPDRTGRAGRRRTRSS
jgi:hypothetical protein